MKREKNMGAQATESRLFSFGFISKVVIACAAIFLIAVTACLLTLPSLLSSATARRNVAAYLSDDLHRPVSINELSFSWEEGLAVSGFTIGGEGEFPLFHLDNLTFIVSWSDLLTGAVTIETLAIDGIEATLVRNEAGKLNIVEMLQAPERDVPTEEEAEFSLPALPPLFVKAHIKRANLTFIDERLGTATRIKNLGVDLSVPSLVEPMTLLLTADVVVNDRAPEPIELRGTANLASEGEVDLKRAQGKLDMKVSFGNLNLLFDLDKFNASEEAIGATLSCFLDLQRLTQLAAGILGLPPGLSVKGTLKANLEARGNRQSAIAVNGETALKGLFVTGGPFKDAPFEQPHVSFSQSVLINFAAGTIDIESVALTSDLASLSVSGAINDFRGNPQAKLFLSGESDLKELLPLVKLTAALPPDLKTFGTMSTSLLVTGDLQKPHCKGKADIRNLTVGAAFLEGQPLREELVRISSDFTLDTSTNALDLASLSVRGETLDAEVAGTLDGATNINMEGHLSTTLPALKRKLPGVLPSEFPDEGKLSSDFAVEGSMKDSLAIKGEHTVIGVTVTLPSSSDDEAAPGALLSLPELRIAHDAVYTPREEKVILRALGAQSSFLDLEGSGSLSELSQTTHLNCQGNASLNMPQLQELLKSFLPEELASKGKGSITFTLEGPLDPPEGKPLFTSLRGKGRISAEEIDYTGLGSIRNIEATEVSLEEGAIHCSIGGLLKVFDLTESSPPPPVTSFSEVAIVSDWMYAPDQDTLTLTALSAESPFLNLEASGSLLELSERARLKCQGKGQLDMPEVEKLLKDFLPEDLAGGGKGTIVFSLEGDLNASDEKPFLSSWDGNGSLLVDGVTYQPLGSIKDLRTTDLSLKKGLLRTILEFSLNNGPSKAKVAFDFGQESADVNVTIDGKDIELTQDIKILDYIVPIVILPPAGRFSSEGEFSVQASWRGLSWDTEISKTITGEGKLTLREGTLSSQNILSKMLKTLGQPETLEFEEISTGFRLADGKLLNENIRVNGKELDFAIQGWTSLAYDPTLNGNPIEYRITGDFLKKSLGEDAQKVLTVIGGGQPTLPFTISGTVQKPKVARIEERTE
jgi:hypothetical protein